ncbi:MAG: hypothetical protein NT107_15655 [Planctomycetota bacterium]|nr:hypothetical protein [Planctomycetota bacterium]
MTKPPSGSETHGFLGEEFITWLWFRWETSGGEFILPGGRVIGIAIDDFLTFAAPSDDETEHTLRHGLPTRTEEARTALRQGRRVHSARLIVAEANRQWVATLDGATMQLTGVKLPEDAEEVESDSDRTADRVANWLALHEIMKALYGIFLRDRLAPNYRATGAEQQAQWMMQ